MNTGRPHYGAKRPARRSALLWLALREETRQPRDVDGDPPRLVRDDTQADVR
jgi:hypothetical protein